MGSAIGPITDELWVVSRLSVYRGLLIDCTSCWLLSHLGLLRLERRSVKSFSILSSSSLLSKSDELLNCGW